MGNLWKCLECGAILQKGSPWLGDTFRRSGIIVGTATCGTAALNSVNLTYTAVYMMLMTTRRNGGNSGSMTWNQRHEEGLK